MKRAEAEINGLRWITFDLGGTLISPTPTVGEIYAEILAAHAIKSDPDGLNERFPAALKRWTHALSPRQNPRDERGIWRHIVWQTLGEELVETTPEEQLQEAFDDLFNAFAEGKRWKVLPDVRATLADLRCRGFRLAVLSNSDSRMRRVLADLRLDDSFEAIFLSGEMGWEKPDLALFRCVAHQLSAEPGHLLHIGDSSRHDIEGAAAAGWRAFLVETGYGLPPAESLLADHKA
jgi:REG-2-like HAD superfamily hydrolase